MGASCSVGLSGSEAAGASSSKTSIVGPGGTANEVLATRWKCSDIFSTVGRSSRS